MPWYWYKRDGWKICIDAMNRQDAERYIKRYATGAVFQGEAIILPTWANPST